MNDEPGEAKELGVEWLKSQEYDSPMTANPEKDSVSPLVFVKALIFSVWLVQGENTLLWQTC